MNGKIPVEKVSNIGEETLEEENKIRTETGLARKSWLILKRLEKNMHSYWNSWRMWFNDAYVVKTQEKLQYKFIRQWP